MKESTLMMSAGGGLGLGPVFTYEWITSSRRWQGYALRLLFLNHERAQAGS
jgi:hypothetical protein